MTIMRSTLHQCPTCKTGFKGLGSKERANACFKLGIPPQDYPVGERVLLRSGAAQTFRISATKVSRRVVRDRSTGDVVRAFHVRKYYLRNPNQKKGKWVNGADIMMAVRKNKGNIVTS